MSTTAPALAVNATLYRKLNYNAIRDLAPEMLVSSTPPILMVHPSVPAKNVKELVALAVTTLKRAPSLPKLPTVDETLKGFESDNWYGMFFPAKTPANIISRFHAEMMKVLGDADVKKLMETRAPCPSAPAPMKWPFT